MKVTVDLDYMKQAFFEIGCDSYFTDDGLKALLDYYDEDAEFDPEEICRYWTEYGKDVDCSFDDLIIDYVNEYPRDEWMEDNGFTEDDLNKMNTESRKELYIGSLLDRLHEKTDVFVLPNGNVIVFGL